MSMVVANIGNHGDLLPWSSIFLFMTNIKSVASNKRFIEELGAGGGGLRFLFFMSQTIFFKAITIQ